MYVIPLQAMSQRRAHASRRARLMAAGAVLLNLAVNVMTFGLLGIGYLRATGGYDLPPAAPFLAIVIISTFVAAYCLYRWRNPRDYQSYAGG